MAAAWSSFLGPGKKKSFEKRKRWLRRKREWREAYDRECRFLKCSKSSATSRCSKNESSGDSSPGAWPGKQAIIEINADMRCWTREENKLLTRVERGTPCGELLPRYWHQVAAAGRVHRTNVHQAGQDSRRRTGCLPRQAGQIRIGRRTLPASPGFLGLRESR